MKIIPSVVEGEIGGCINTITPLLPFYNRFQIDIEDGVFTPNKTLSIDDAFSCLRQLNITGDKKTYFDFHLMEIQHELSLEKIIQQQNNVLIDTVLVHSALCFDYSSLSKMYPSIKLGIVVNPEETVDHIIHTFDLDSVPIIQIMTVHPGKQGQAFISDSLQKIEQLRKSGFTHEVYLDGGINEDSLPLIKQLSEKPDGVCPGSYLTRAGQDLSKHVEHLSYL